MITVWGEGISACGSETLLKPKSHLHCWLWCLASPNIYPWLSMEFRSKRGACHAKSWSKSLNHVLILLTVWGGAKSYWKMKSATWLSLCQTIYAVWQILDMCRFSQTFFLSLRFPLMWLGAILLAAIFFSYGFCGSLSVWRVFTGELSSQQLFQWLCSTIT